MKFHVTEERFELVLTREEAQKLLYDIVDYLMTGKPLKIGNFEISLTIADTSYIGKGTPPITSRGVIE